jgi:hypothetical protein
MSLQTDRIAALERLVANYEKSLGDFTVINEELRSLPASPRLTEIIALNETTIASTTRLLDTARERLARERTGLVSVPPFAES